jgi:hypothetical protein
MDDDTIVEGWCEKGQHFVRRPFRDYIRFGICTEHPEKESAKAQRQRLLEELTKQQPVLNFGR